jgi:hypothetical protein
MHDPSPLSDDSPEVLVPVCAPVPVPVPELVLPAPLVDAVLLAVELAPVARVPVPPHPVHIAAPTSNVYPATTDTPEASFADMGPSARLNW